GQREAMPPASTGRKGAGRTAALNNLVPADAIALPALARRWRPARSLESGGTRDRSPTSACKFASSAFAVGSAPSSASLDLHHPWNEHRAANMVDEISHEMPNDGRLNPFSPEKPATNQADRYVEDERACQKKRSDVPSQRTCGRYNGGVNEELLMRLF